MKIAIYGSRSQDEHIKRLASFLRDLKLYNIEVVMHAKLYQYLLRAVPGALAAVTRVTEGGDFTADYAVSLGGDGTFLRTAMWVGEKQIPIIGVNTGHLGYLAAFDVKNLALLPDILVNSKLQTRDCSLIEVEADNLMTWPYALNEIAITKEETSSMLTANVEIDNIHLGEYRADGLLVATPTGSTAYNLSVGGPIVQPQAPVRIISPIAAHSLSMRPLVVRDDSVIKITTSSRALHYRLSLDGRSSSRLAGSTITLKRASFVIRVAEPCDHNFAKTLCEKLQWGKKQF
jgi:NAD+ kinase